MGNESIVLEGGHVRLEPLDLWHNDALVEVYSSATCW
jgi:hypothetical protein